MADSTPSNTIPGAGIRELQTRFLYPFFFQLGVMVMLAATLGAVAAACAVLPDWKQIFSVIVVAMGLFSLLFLHHKGAFGHFFPRAAVAETTGHGASTETKAHAEEKSLAHATGLQHDFWIVGSWAAFTALCVAIRMSRPRHGGH